MIEMGDAQVERLCESVRQSIAEYALREMGFSVDDGSPCGLVWSKGSEAKAVVGLDGKGNVCLSYVRSKDFTTANGRGRISSVRKALRAIRKAERRLAR